MAIPTNREEMKEYALRRLGKPVININVSDDQIDDRIDEALKFFYDYHSNGTEKIYYKHQITANNIAQGYIEMPDNIMGVVRIFDIGTSIASGSGMFSVQYQIALNDLYSFSGMDLIPYWMTQESLQFMETILVGMKPIRYSKSSDRLFIDMDWKTVSEGQYLIVEAYEIMDPEVYSDVWSERWLMKYVTALIKRQWGSNLIKFEGIQLPGGVTFNGRAIYDEADAEADAAEKDLVDNSPLEFMMG